MCGSYSYKDYCVWIVVFSLILRMVFIGFNGLLVEEAYYWDYAQHLDFGYLDHPPMVALLIKASLFVFGFHEYSVHLPAMICWLATAFFIFRLTELISKGAGWFAVMLLSILPFFFLQSVVTTPDPAVMVCWSAALYCLYRVLVLEEGRYWYATGVWLGLGLLSKYTIVLLGLPVLFYMATVPSARVWFTRKEPYIAAVLALIIFSPVIYWNATHEWASFAFQSVKRFNSPSSFALHKFIGLVLFVLTPMGVWGVWQLMRKTNCVGATINKNAQWFLQWFTVLPLAFFCFYSLNHLVKFDWVGPGLLAVIPWFACLMHKTPHRIAFSDNIRLGWFITVGVFLAIYCALISVVTFGVPEIAHKNFLKRYFAWGELSRALNAVASDIEAKTHIAPIFAPLDAYNISSELSFYQAMYKNQGSIQKVYPVIGRHIFNCNSLMYKYWDNGDNLSGKTLILITSELPDFEIRNVVAEVIDKSSLHIIWSYSERGHSKIQPFYYKVVEMKPYKELKFAQPYDKN